MQLKRLTVKNYRTLRDIEINFDSNYCTISGHNNAGKSSIIKLISHVFGENRGRRYYHPLRDSIKHSSDCTHWSDQKDNIDVSYTIIVDEKKDYELKDFIERYAKVEKSQQTIELLINIILKSNEEETVICHVNGIKMDFSTSRGISSKIKQSNTLFLHNSTEHLPDVYYGDGRILSMLDVILSNEEREELKTAENNLNRKLKKVAKGHKIALNSMIGRLSEKYEVELSSLESFGRRNFPLGINIKDRNVDIPLTDWGSGSQNRTHILISILQASRVGANGSDDEKITPIVVIEEPESFLHPSAQAEFGKILQSLSNELDIQIIVSTHSPFMLNQLSPRSNILLKRKISRNKQEDTEIVDTSGKDWMAPFAEHLGMVSPEFGAWKDLFLTESGNVLLVEGDIDREYFTLFRNSMSGEFPLNKSIEIVSYGGKDALKNTAIVKFILSKLNNVFITFDRDAESQIAPFLERLGLINGKDFQAVGLNTAGRDAIEGILPDRVISAVAAREPGLMLELASGDSAVRKQAKSKFKRLLLDECKATASFEKTELKEIARLGQIISKRFARL